MNSTQNKGQTAIEYMLLLAVTVGIILVALPNYLPRVGNAANIYFNKATAAILGEAPTCGNGVPDFGEDNERCCDDDPGGC